MNMGRYGMSDEQETKKRITGHFLQQIIWPAELIWQVALSEHGMMPTMVLKQDGQFMGIISLWKQC